MTEHNEHAADRVEQATGWRPPVIYDVTIDGARLVTQEDVDRWQEIIRAYGEMQRTLREIAERDAQLRHRIGAPPR